MQRSACCLSTLQDPEGRCRPRPITEMRGVTGAPGMPYATCVTSKLAAGWLTSYRRRARYVAYSCDIVRACPILRAGHHGRRLGSGTGTTMKHDAWPDDTGLIHRYSRYGIGYYCRRGKGATAVVLIPGMGASSHNWRLVVPLLPPDTPLVIIDLPWCATSRKYHGRFDRDGLISAMADCVAEAWTGPVFIAAHSIGASFGRLMANHDAITVRALVPISGHLFGVSKILRNPLSINALPLRISLADAILRAMIAPGPLIRTTLDRSSIARQILLWPFMNSRLISVNSLVGECLQENGGIGALRLLKSARQVDLLHALEYSDKPTSVVFGERDPLLTPDDNRQMEKFANVTSIRKVASGRHFPLIEAPDVVASAIIEQLKA